MHAYLVCSLLLRYSSPRSGCSHFGEVPECQIYHDVSKTTEVIGKLHVLLVAALGLFVCDRLDAICCPMKQYNHSF
jgi:hypothetical protein